MCVYSGQCGFPGRPLNGKVLIVKNPEVNETNWERYLEIPRVAYQCDTGLTVGDERTDHYRDCVNGSWTGQVPQCGELLENSN